MSISRSRTAVLVILMVLAMMPAQSWAIEIETPAPGTIVHPGDTVLIRVVPSPGERVGGVFFRGITGDLVEEPPYEYRYPVDSRTLGEIKIHIVAVTPEEQFSSEADLRLKVTLPPP